MSSVQMIQLVILVLYLVGLLVLGWLATRLDASMEDYFLADRGLGAWASAISSTSSSESGWVTLGAVGMGYASGMSAAWFIPGCLLGYCVNWYFIAPRLREVSKRRNTITIPDFLEDRVNDRDRLIRVVSVLIIFLAMAAYIGAQFKASGKLFSNLFFQGSTWGRNVGIVTGASITIIYTMMGGFRASAWTDLIQGLIMAIGLTMFPFVLFVQIGGVGSFLSRLGEQPARSWIEYEVRFQPDEQSVATKQLRLDVSDREHTVYIFRDKKTVKIRTSAPEQKEILGQFHLRANRDETGGEISYTISEFRSSRDSTMLKVQEGTGHGFQSDTVPPDNVEPMSLPVSISPGWSYFLSSRLRVRPTTKKTMNTGSDLIDPFGDKNNQSNTEQPTETNSSPLIPIPASLGLVIGLMGIGLGYPGMPHVLSRYMATKDQKNISRARVIAVVWGVLAFYGAVVIGMQARVLLAPEQLADQELAFPVLATEYMSPILSGILISAILAAIMSSADSMIIVATSAVTRDLYQNLLRPDADQEKLVWISRMTVFVLGLLGVIAAILNVQLIFWFVLVAWAVLGASFGPPVLLAITWRGLTRWGVLSGLIVGAVSALLFKVEPAISQFLFGLHLYELVPAFFLSLVVTVGISLITSPPEDVDERM